MDTDEIEWCISDFMKMKMFFKRHEALYSSFKMKL